MRLLKGEDSGDQEASGMTDEDRFDVVELSVDVTGLDMTPPRDKTLGCREACDCKSCWSLETSCDFIVSKRYCLYKSPGDVIFEGEGDDDATTVADGDATRFGDASRFLNGDANLSVSGVLAAIHRPSSRVQSSFSALLVHIKSVARPMAGLTQNDNGPSDEGRTSLAFIKLISIMVFTGFPSARHVTGSTSITLNFSPRKKQYALWRSLFTGFMMRR